MSNPGPTGQYSVPMHSSQNCTAQPGSQFPGGGYQHVLRENFQQFNNPGISQTQDPDPFTDAQVAAMEKQLAQMKIQLSQFESSVQDAPSNNGFSTTSLAPHTLPQQASQGQQQVFQGLMTTPDGNTNQADHPEKVANSGLPDHRQYRTTPPLAPHFQNFGYAPTHIVRPYMQYGQGNVPIYNGYDGNHQNMGYDNQHEPYNNPDDDYRKARKDKKKYRKDHERDFSDCGEETDTSKSSRGKEKASKTKKVTFLSAMEELRPLGKFRRLDEDDKVYRTLVRYAKNSCGLSKSAGKVEVHGICKLSGNTKRCSEADSQPLLLWFKTSPKNVHQLEDKYAEFLVFYDRLAPAFAVNPKKLAQPLRQILLLCAVDTGNLYETQYNHEYWEYKRVPAGHDTVKTVGRLTVDWEDNRDNGSVTVPCGKTVPHANTSFSRYEADYNEYIVHDASRVSVRYAVDLEVIPL